MSNTHDIYYSFDERFETRLIFLDISKVFDKLWHKGLVYKLRLFGFSGDLLPLLIDFLTNRNQRVVLNGQNSSWVDIKAGVPQGSTLRPPFFLLYTNDVTENLNSNLKFFANDTSSLSIVNNVAQSNSQLSSV